VAVAAGSVLADSFQIALHAALAQAQDQLLALLRVG